MSKEICSSVEVVYLTKVVLVDNAQLSFCGDVSLAMCRRYTRPCKRMHLSIFRPSSCGRCRCGCWGCSWFCTPCCKSLNSILVQKLEIRKTFSSYLSLIIMLKNKIFGLWPHPLSRALLIPSWFFLATPPPYLCSY